MKKCRIIGGAFKRRYITAPELSSTRPTADIVKQAVFNVLVHRFCIKFDNSLVIDLFAGSGSLGIEAVSRGCKNAIFVDSNKQAIECIRKNIEMLDITGYAQIIHNSADRVSDDKVLAWSKNVSNILVFLDPPYEEKELLQQQMNRFFKLFKSRNLFIIAESDKELKEATYIVRHGDIRVNMYSYLEGDLI